jgi:hypothetical protein
MAVCGCPRWAIDRLLEFVVIDRAGVIMRAGRRAIVMLGRATRQRKRIHRAIALMAALRPVLGGVRDREGQGALAREAARAKSPAVVMRIARAAAVAYRVAEQSAQPRESSSERIGTRISAAQHRQENAALIGELDEDCRRAARLASHDPPSRQASEAIKVECPRLHVHITWRCLCRAILGEATGWRQ